MHSELDFYYDCDTKYIERQQMKCADIDELIDFINQNQEFFFDWKQYISNLVQCMGLSYGALAKKCGFSKNTVKNWCCAGRLPQNREAFIKLGFGLNMNVEEINRLLTRYGKYAELYPKDVHDAVCIYVIHKRENNWDDPRYQYKALDFWYKKYESIILSLTSSPSGRIMDTKDVYGYILTDDEKEFERFVFQNKDIFFNTYSKLKKYIDKFIAIRLKEEEILSDQRISLHKWIKDNNINSKFEKIISNLRVNNILPSRTELIALGVHLNMTLENINTMLSLANMRELYIKNKMECFIMFLLRDISVNNPDIELNNAYKLEQYTENVMDRKKYSDIIKKYFDKEYELKNDDDFISVKDYILKKLSDINECSELFEVM